MTFKALTGKLPKYLVELFTKCENENYNLRSNNVKLSLGKPKQISEKEASPTELLNHGTNFRVN